MGWVKEGTRTTASLAQDEANFRDAERRRNEQDAERRVANVPIDQGGGRLYNNVLATHDEAGLPKGHVLLEYVNEKGEPIICRGIPLVCLADVLVPNEPAFEGEKMLILFCPRCNQDRKHQADSLITVRQANKAWHLDERTFGHPIVYIQQDQQGNITKELHRSVGTVMDSEKFHCPQCWWYGVIDKNKVRPV